MLASTLFPSDMLPFPYILKGSWILYLSNYCLFQKCFFFLNFLYFHLAFKCIKTEVVWEIWFSTSYAILARYILSKSKENLNPHVITPGWQKPAKTAGIIAFALWSEHNISSKHCRSRRTFKTLLHFILLTITWRWNREAQYLKVMGERKQKQK